MKFTDSASFLAIYDEVFNKKIYKFHTNNDMPYIIDCGANIGLSILYFAKEFPKATILAFEPDEKSFNIIEHNIIGQGSSNITIIKKGLWKEDAVLEFNVEGADGGRLNYVSNIESSRKTEVPVTTLSTYLDRDVDFLKIDIEGAEYEVLKECRDKLHHVKNLFVEYHSFVDQPQKLDQIIEILRNSGFRYYINNSGVRSKKPFIKRKEMLGMDLQINVFAYR